jgi:major membrane immunogen (membrane-anchored lipoprotein)
VRRGPAFIVFALALALLLLPGCKDDSRALAYRDGSYTGKSGEDDNGAYGEATITIEGGKIADCDYVTWQKDGTIKDENYGKVNGEISNQTYYEKAQLAVKAMKHSAEKLVEVQKLKEVDSISGATISYNQFKEAVDDALDKAKK